MVGKLRYGAGAIAQRRMQKQLKMAQQQLAELRQKGAMPAVERAKKFGVQAGEEIADAAKKLPGDAKDLWRRTKATSQFQGATRWASKWGSRIGPALTVMSVAGAVSGAEGPYEKLKQGSMAAANVGVWDITSKVIGKVGKVGLKMGLMKTMAVGAAVGFAAEFAVSETFNFLEARAGTARDMRTKGMDWGKSDSFHTEKAYTMRQHALSQMNRGEMSARSLLGREAQLMHK